MQEPDGGRETSASTDEADNSGGRSVRLQSEQHQSAKEAEPGYDRDYSEEETERQIRTIRAWLFRKLREATLIDVFEMVTGVVLVLVGVIAAFIYHGQLAEMRHTNELTQKALDGSDKTLEATLTKMQGQIDQTKRLADETHTANQNTILIDRPWLGIVIEVTNFGPNKIPVKTININNSGKRPAMITSFVSNGDYFKVIPTSPPYPGASSIKKQFLVPGTRYVSVVNLFQDSGIISSPALQLLDQKEKIFFVYASVEYVDVRNGEKHFTHACVYYLPATKESAAQFVGCSTYNDGD